MISCSNHQWMFQFHFCQWRITARVPKCASKHVEGRKCKTHPIQTGSGSHTRRTQEERQHLTPLLLILKLDRKCLALYCGVCCSLSPSHPAATSTATFYTECSARWIISASVAQSHNPSLLVIYITIRLLFCFFFLFFKTSHCISQYFIPCSCTYTYSYLRHDMLVFRVYLFKSACL